MDLWQANILWGNILRFSSYSVHSSRQVVIVGIGSL